MCLRVHLAVSRNVLGCLNRGKTGGHERAEGKGCRTVYGACGRRTQSTGQWVPVLPTVYSIKSHSNVAGSEFLCSLPWPRGTEALIREFARALTIFCIFVLGSP